MTQNAILITHAIHFTAWTTLTAIAVLLIETNHPIASLAAALAATANWLASYILVKEGKRLAATPGDTPT